MFKNSTFTSGERLGFIESLDAKLKNIEDFHKRVAVDVLLLLLLFLYKKQVLNGSTVEPQWLEHLWDYGNSFETWVVRATEGNHGTSSGSK